MPTAHSAANRRGIVAMSLGMASFLANDGLVKYLSQSLPTAQLICIRGLFATVFLLLIARHMGLLRPGQAAGAAPLRQLARGPVLLRSVIDAVATMAYLGALFHLPIGNATAINSRLNVRTINSRTCSSRIRRDCFFVAAIRNRIAAHGNSTYRRLCSR